PAASSRLASTSPSLGASWASATTYLTAPSISGVRLRARQVAARSDERVLGGRCPALVDGRDRLLQVGGASRDLPGGDLDQLVAPLAGQLLGEVAGDLVAG